MAGDDVRGGFGFELSPWALLVAPGRLVEDGVGEFVDGDSRYFSLVRLHLDFDCILVVLVDAGGVAVSPLLARDDLDGESAVDGDRPNPFEEIAGTSVGRGVEFS